ncbi:MAG: hypothetical protein V2I63_08955, partial [Pseudomonadales bacterium]|nr:hypothetical protein [Pseudomonadales bacterium]
ERARRFATLWPQWSSGTPESGFREALLALARDDHGAACLALAHGSFAGAMGLARDPGAAFLWALRGARCGFAAAAAMTGDFYLHAEPEHHACVRDVRRALHWHEQAALAGHAGAALAASDSYRMGRGVERDFRRAAVLLGLAVALDPSPPGITRLLRPSLEADLSPGEMEAVDQEVQDALRGLPRADADLDAFWRQAHEDLAGDRVALARGAGAAGT